MREFKLLYSYEEWKERNTYRLIPKSEFKAGISEETARHTELLLDGITAALRNEDFDGQEELDRLTREREEREVNEKFTNLTHQITDLCLNPKKHYVDLKRVGKLAYELERLKYPVVVPKREE